MANAIDLAFAILKTPWRVHSDHWSEPGVLRPESANPGMQPNLRGQGDPVELRGPLYSGGDREDTPQYWSPNLDTALAYALFGSAVPKDSTTSNQVRQLGGIPMRETRPQVWVAPDPKHSPRAPIRRDTFSDAFMNMPNKPVVSQPMSQSELREIIEDIISGKRDMEAGWTADTSSAWGHLGPHDSDAHIRGALERFDTGVAGNLTIPDKLEGLISDAYHDTME